VVSVNLVVNGVLERIHVFEIPQAVIKRVSVPVMANHIFGCFCNSSMHFDGDSFSTMLDPPHCVPAMA